MKMFARQLCLSLALALLLGAASASAATITVNSTADPAGFNQSITIAGLGSTITLRDAINAVNNTGGTHTITFAPSLANSTINLLQSQEPNGPSAFFIGLQNVACNVTIQGLTGNGGVTISSNGAMRIFYANNSSSYLTVNDLTLTNGYASPGGTGGGAILVYQGNVTLNRCTITGNSAYEGGGIYGDNGYLTLNNCTIFNNTALVYQDYYAGHGGGIYVNITGTTLTNCTVTRNSGEISGGGIYTPTVRPLLVNTIVADNDSGSAPSGAPNYQAIQGFVASSSHHNLIVHFSGTVDTGGMQDGVNNNIVLSGFDSGVDFLANNGGPTQTCAVQRNSRAIDAGTAVAGITSDQRGVARPQFGAPDIGAYEFNGAVTESLVVTTTADELNFSSDPSIGAGTSLREAVRYANSLGGSQTITFAPALAGQTVTLSIPWSNATTYESTTALTIAGNITIQGLTNSPGVTLAVSPSPQLRHFLVNSNAALTISNLTLSGGQAFTAGYNLGGAIWDFGSLTVRNCTFTGNSSGAEGGAIQVWGESPLLMIDNSTFSGNASSATGGAIDCGALSMTFHHVTITNNSATNGNALNIYGHPLTMINSIIGGNVNDGVRSVNGGTFAAQSTNNILGSGGTAGLTTGVNGNLTGVPAASLYLGSLANNGGPTPTIALQPASPAINFGVAIAGLTTDQRGNTRTVGNAPDAGAFEDPTGNDDPDGDSLSNAQEFTGGTNPLALDSDGDGYNDATEVMAGSNPNSAASVPPPTHVERVLGFGAARGLDLTGNFIYAFNVGTPGAAGKAGDATFTADNAFGITVTAPNEISSWTVRDFSNSAADGVLETVYHSIRWADFGNANPNLRALRVDLANLVVGRKYKLQLLFAENSDYNRRFDVLAEGQLIADDFNVSTAQGIPLRANAAAAIVHEFTATDTTLNVVLDGSNIAVPGADRNPILNGVTLEDLSALAPLITPSENVVYQSSVQVSIVNNSPGTTIRYTTDGSTPTDTTGTIYSGSFALTNSATVRAVAYGNGLAPSQVISANYTVLPPLPYWRNLQGLSADGSQDLGNPSGDGVANLLKFAFNMAPNAGDLPKANCQILTDNGTAGLPLITHDAQRHLVIEFVRRKASSNPGITYAVETGQLVTGLTALDLTGANVVSIDTIWERVTAIDPATTLTRFGRVRVTTTP